MKMTSAIGIGADIEEVSRFRRRRSDPVLRKIFSSRELSYCFSKKDPAPHLAARFCAKESVIKALGNLGIKKVTINDVEIVRAANGAVSARLTPGRLGKLVVVVTLSHTRDLALSFAVAHMAAVPLARRFHPKI